MPDPGSFSAVPRRRRWLLFMPFALVVVLAAGWSVVWFYAAARAEPELAAWREAERRAGRTQDCASQSIGGYPFRIEVRCGGAGLELKGTPTLQLKLPFAAVAVQVYDPKLMIAEFTGPLEVSEPERARVALVNWNLGQASVRGLPSGMERASLVLVGPSIRVPSLAGNDAVFSARRLELHGRQAPGSPADNPTVEAALRPPWRTSSKTCSIPPPRTRSACSPPTRPMRTLRPPCGAWTTSVPSLGRHGSRNGRRAAGSGVLQLTPRGGLEGNLQVTVVGIEKILKMFDIDRIMSEGQIGATFNALDRLVPGLGGIARQSAAPSLIAALGQRTTLEGKPAVAFPIRFVDGTVFLGPFQVGAVPPLF